MKDEERGMKDEIAPGRGGKSGDKRAMAYPAPERIRKLRHAAGYRNIARLAGDIGVTARAVQHYEDGTRRMSDVLICVKFARAVGVPLEAILAR